MLRLVHSNCSCIAMFMLRLLCYRLQCNALPSLHCIQLCIRLYSLNLLLHCKAIQCIVIWSKLHCIYCLHCTADRRSVYNYTSYFAALLIMCRHYLCVQNVELLQCSLFLKVLSCAVHCTEKLLFLISVTQYVCAVQCYTAAVHNSSALQCILWSLGRKGQH